MRTSRGELLSITTNLFEHLSHRPNLSRQAVRHRWRHAFKRTVPATKVVVHAVDGERLAVVVQVFL
jgi:hypothetical protein